MKRLLECVMICVGAWATMDWLYVNYGVIPAAIVGCLCIAIDFGAKQPE